MHVITMGSYFLLSLWNYTESVLVDIPLFDFQITQMQISIKENLTLLDC